MRAYLCYDINNNGISHGTSMEPIGALLISLPQVKIIVINIGPLVCRGHDGGDTLLDDWVRLYGKFVCEH